MEKTVVIGIGKLGLCFALQLEKAGYEVLGIDTQADYVRSLRDGSFQSPEPGLKEALQSARNFRPSSDWNDLHSFPAQLIFLAVPTPISEKSGYDSSIVDEVLHALFSISASSLRKDIVIICTTEPGYCDKAAREALNHNHFISYKPEFIAQGTIMRDLQFPDLALFGEADGTAGDKLESVYSKIAISDFKVCRMSRLSAEIVKLATNCFLTMKISFANAIGDLSLKTGADKDKVLAAIGGDRRIGDQFLHYGFGYGGPCFPRDNRALRYFAEKHELDLPLSRAADQANQNHLDFQFQQYMTRYAGDEVIHFHSVTYKPDTLILEESQQLALAIKLARAGKKVVIHEREEVLERLREIYQDLFEWSSNGSFTKAIYQ